MARQTQIGKSVALSTEDTTNDDLSVPTTAFVRNDRSYPHPTLISGSVEANGGIYNGNFRTAPPFVAVQTASNWINGTAAGGSGEGYGWYFLVGTNNVSCRFDPYVTHSNGHSLKMSCTNTVGVARVFNTSTVTVAGLSRNAPRLKPSTKYRLSFWMKTYNVATNAAFIQYRQYDADAVIGTSAVTTYVSGTTDWTYYEAVFTSDADAAYLFLALHNYVAGNVSDVWYDDINIEEVIEDTGYTGVVPTSLLPIVSAVSSYDNMDIDKVAGSTVTTYVTYTWIAQQFSPTRGNIGQIGLRLLRNGAAAQTMTIAVEGDTGSNAPSGVLFASKVFDCSTLVDDNTLHEIILDLPCILTAGTKYWVTTKISAATANVGFGVLAGTYTEYRSYGVGAWTTSNTTAQYDIRTYAVKRTQGISIVCNGERILLNADSDGLLEGSTIDFDKGTYVYDSGSNASVGGVGEALARNIHTTSAGGSTAPTIVSGFTYVPDANGFYSASDSTERYMTIKVNTLLPVTHLELIAEVPTSASTEDKQLQISLDESTWTTLDQSHAGVTSFAYANTDIANGASTFFIRIYKPATAGRFRFVRLGIYAELDISAISLPIVYPFTTNQFAAETNSWNGITRIVYYKNKYMNKNGVVCPHIVLASSAGTDIIQIPLPIDNSLETNPAVDIIVAETTNGQQSGTGSNDGSTGYILNDTEYMTLTTGAYFVKVTYKIGYGTTSFSNITKNTIYITSDGFEASSTDLPSLMVDVIYNYRVQSISNEIENIKKQIITLNNKTPVGVWKDVTSPTHGTTTGNTFVWTTATPTITAMKYRYCIVGKTVHINIYVNSADTNGATGLSIVLPVKSSTKSSYSGMCGFEWTTASGYTNPLPYINCTNSVVGFAAFTAGVDGASMSIVISGFYEID